MMENFEFDDFQKFTTIYGAIMFGQIYDDI